MRRERPPAWFRSQLLHIREPLAVSPAMHELAGHRRRCELSERLHLDRAGPIAGLHLDQHRIARADSDDIPFAKTRGRASASIARRFKQLHRAVLVSGALGFGVHRVALLSAERNRNGGANDPDSDDQHKHGGVGDLCFLLCCHGGKIAGLVLPVEGSAIHGPRRLDFRPARTVHRGPTMQVECSPMLQKISPEPPLDSQQRVSVLTAASGRGLD